jgi:hypothetical protein
VFLLCWGRLSRAALEASAAAESDWLAAAQRADAALKVALDRMGR